MRFEPKHAAAVRSLRAILALSLALAATPVLAGPTELAATIRVEEAWIRWLPTGIPAGGYMTLTNGGDTVVNLIAASSPAYAEVSMHRSIERGGTVAMRPVTQIAIDPHASVNFAAAGYHFMLMQPVRPLEPGDRVPISLRFNDGSSLTVQFEVRK
jgi:periplasmic copper chaperone A